MTPTYNLSPKLKKLLNENDKLRQALQLEIISPEKEIAIQWQTQLDRIHWSLRLANEKTSRQEINQTLTSLSKTKMSPIELQITRYLKTLNYLKQNWSVSTEHVEFSEIIYLIKQHNQPTTKEVDSKLKTMEPDISKFLKYIQTGSDHPVIQSGITYIQLEQLLSDPITKNLNSSIPPIAYVFLYKHGYTFRYLLQIEQSVYKERSSLNLAREIAENRNNLTPWLETYTEGLNQQLKSTYKKIREQKQTPTNSGKIHQLNNRQKEILTILEQPNRTISNREVQKTFKISQITASRDLAKLNTLGLVFPQGKGRSVTYSRI